jgi:hypothetical protein
MALCTGEPRGASARSFQIADRLETVRANVSFRWSLMLAAGLDAVSTSEGWAVDANGSRLVTLTSP